MKQRRGELLKLNGSYGLNTGLTIEVIALMTHIKTHLRTHFMNSIRPIDLATIDEMRFKGRFVGCIVLTQNKKILLQQRGDDWHSHPGVISTFGGRIESHEHPKNALIRELKEELGAQVQESDIVSLGAYTEAVTQHTELVYGYFWHDKQGTMTGCYEGEARYYDNIADILALPKLMDGVRWLIYECKNRQLL